MPDQTPIREAGWSRGFASRAGHRALDLTNTIGWRLDEERRHERLIDDEAALVWIAMFELCDDAEMAELSGMRAGGVVENLRAVREHIYGAAMEMRPTDAAALLDLDRRRLERIEMVPAPAGGWTTREIVIDEQTPALRLAHEAVELLTEPSPPIKQCADDACGWIYLDTSPRRNRRWCAADDCGTRNRSRAYYRRLQSR